MKVNKFKILIFLIVLLSSCVEPTGFRTLDWNGNTIKFSVFTSSLSSDLFKIHYKRKFMGRDRLIFESYDFPPVTNISIENNNLKIQCGTNTIAIIDLKNIDKFIRNPVVYKRSILIKTNKYYIEPAFIKEQRELRNRHKLN